MFNNDKIHVMQRPNDVISHSHNPTAEENDGEIMNHNLRDLGKRAQLRIDNPQLVTHDEVVTKTDHTTTKTHDVK